MLLVVVANLHRRRHARKCNFEAGDKWYEHKPKHVLENEDYKILGISVFRLIMLYKVGDQI